MIIKLLQLNIQKGKFLPQIIDYVKKEKFDICTFQEVTGGLASFDQKIDCFQTLTDHLNLKGELGKSYRFKEDKKSYFGNAILFSKQFILEQKEILQLKPYKETDYIRDGDPRFMYTPHSGLILQLKILNISFFVISTHGAWSQKAEDTPEKIRQAKILYQRLLQFKSPYILAGDFNMVRGTQVVNLYESRTTNLTAKFHVKNTLNLRLHHAKNELPHGLAVDHIFISEGIIVKDFHVFDIDLSDHLPLTLDFRLG